MTYVNTTGKHIGECLTGFGTNYKVYIYNSGNSDVEYDIDILNNDDIFFVSDDSFVINNGSSKSFDIIYKPDIVGSTSEDETEITILGQSVEDGSVDPNGVITLNITGSRIISNTAGSVRKFTALKKYDKLNGPNYDFRWLPPTGTGNLKNYYFTGYKLEISQEQDFDPLVYQKEIIIPRNSNDKPRFATYYGFPESEIIHNVSKKDFPTIALDVSYYARLFTYSTDNSGISIYATGIDSINDQLSEEVINGNSGTKVDLKIKKKPFNFYIDPGNYINFDLSKELIEANNNSNDFIFYSGINIYFPENSSFTTSDYKNYAVDFNNVILANFTGDTPETYINLYIPRNCIINGNHGKGGDVSNVAGLENVSAGPIILNSTATLYADPKSGYSLPEDGGNVFRLNAKTDTSRTDFVYNLYIEKYSFISSGGGGVKGGAAFLMSTYGKSVDNIPRYNFYPLNGAISILNLPTKFDVLAIRNGRSGSDTNITSDPIAILFSQPSGNGEDAVDVFYYKFNKAILSDKNITDYYKAVAEGTEAILNFRGIGEFQNGYNPFKAVFCPVETPGKIVRKAGYLLQKGNNSSVRLSYYNTDIPSDYIFRLENSFLTNSPSLAWAAKNKLGSTIFTLNTSSGSSYSGNYNSTGYKALTITNGSFLGVLPTPSQNINNLDLYIVGSFNNISSLTSDASTSVINWYKNSDNVSSKNILCKNFPASVINDYEKEKKVFYSFFSLLFDSKIQNNDDFFISNKDGKNSFSSLSNCLVTSSYNIYPFILNIKKSGSSYSIYINGNLNSSYSLNSSNFLSSLSGTTFKLENNNSNINTTFFDLICFDRVLSADENIKLNNYLMQSYIKLFSGTPSKNYLQIDSRIRLPNAFNLAGRI